MFLILKCVIIQRTAVLCLFWTSTDTDGFDHRSSQNQGPLSLSALLSLFPPALNETTCCSRSIQTEVPQHTFYIKHSVNRDFPLWHFAGRMCRYVYIFTYFSPRWLRSCYIALGPENTAWMPYDTRDLLSSLNLRSINLTVNHNKDVLHEQNEHNENKKSSQKPHAIQ